MNIIFFLDKIISDVYNSIFLKNTSNSMFQIVGFVVATIVILWGISLFIANLLSPRISEKALVVSKKVIETAHYQNNLHVGSDYSYQVSFLTENGNKIDKFIEAVKG